MLIVILFAIVFLGLILYWLLIVTEGTYLGARAVALMYDWTATRYDGIKKTQFVDEAYFVGIPIIQRLRHIDRPLILDLATGTARVPTALFRQWGFDCQIIGIDRAGRMLRQAQQATQDYTDRLLLAQGDGRKLPCADNAVDCLVCLEALEFMPQPEIVLQELLRVLRPGGLLVLSNRVGWEARLFWWRVAGRGDLERRLTARGVTEQSTQRWQVHYDMVWAYKPIADVAAADLGRRDSLPQTWEPTVL